jgi:hypothetical protein
MVGSSIPCCEVAENQKPRAFLDRDSRIEWIKLIAILAIIFQHSIHARELSALVLLTHGAVPAFTFLSVCFSVQTSIRSSKPLLQLAIYRIAHLYGLFLIWNTIYFTVRMTASSLGAKSGYGGFNPEQFLLSGYANAMWFLPFILAANLAGLLVGAACRKGDRLRVWTIVLTMALAACVSLSAWFASEDAASKIYLFSIARKAVPSALLGIAMAACRTDITMVAPSRSGCTRSLIIFALSCGLLIYYGRVIYLFETMVGISAIAVVLNSVGRSELTTLNPDIALWLFVAHAWFLHAMRKALMTFSINWDDSSWGFQIVGYLALLASLVAAYVFVSRSRLRRVLLLSRK